MLRQIIFLLIIVCSGTSCGYISQLVFDNNDQAMRIRLFEPNKPKEKVPLLVVRVDSSNSHYLFFYSFYADKIYKYPQKEKRSFRFVTDGSEEYPLSAMDKAVFKTIDSISRPRRAQALKGNQITGFVEEH